MSSRSLVTAHRGDSKNFRENTLAAVRSAIEKGADIVEIDVRQSKDGEVIVLHDRNLERLWGHPMDANKLCLAEIEELGFSDCRIPTLSSILELFIGSPSILMIDMDTPEHALPALRVVNEYQLEYDQVIWCGDLEAMRLIRVHSPSARIWLPWNDPQPVSRDLITAILPEFVNSHFSFWNQEKVSELHEIGIKVAAWTIDDQPTMQWAKAIGIDSITTNDLETLQAVVFETAQVDDFDVNRALELALSLGKWAISVCQQMTPGKINTKNNPADLVTEIDLLIETHAREMILTNFPSHNILGEEFGGNFDPESLTWYIDPIDGTTNFANRTPWSSLSLSLAIGREPLIGVTIDPWRNKLFHAVKGEGAFVNGARIKIENNSETKNPLAGKVVFTELAGSKPWNGMEEFLTQLGANHCTMRIMGAGTLSLTGVPANYGIGAIVDNFSPIDHLAAALIAVEAGCLVLNELGETDLFPETGGMMIVHPHARNALYSIWRSSLGKLDKPADVLS